MNCKNKTNKENIIIGLDLIDEAIYTDFYPTVNKNKYLEYEASNGAVMVVTAQASSLAKAHEKVYSEACDIDFLGKFYRKDICNMIT